MPTKPGVLPNLRALNPSAYAELRTIDDQAPVPIFRARSLEDFDWLEDMIRSHGYYEHVGVWSLDVDEDKRATAEIISSFTSTRALEIGCASGQVLECLGELGVAGEGVEISALAIGRASKRIRPAIHHADLLDVELTSRYACVFGLDIFEHLNPRKLDRYIARIADLLDDGGLLFCNIPAFAHDRVFGSVFPMYLREWFADAARDENFRALHVDDHGWPLHGHLIWATCDWWERQFTSAGFRRETWVETILHRKYDAFYDVQSPARKSFYVFSKNLTEGSRRKAGEAILASRSGVLERFEAMHDARRCVLADGNVFFDGWYHVENGPHGPFRWSQRRAFLSLAPYVGSRVAMKIFSSDPRIGIQPVTVSFTATCGARSLGVVELRAPGPHEYSFVVDDDSRVVEVVVDRCWIPSRDLEGNGDPRELGVGISDVAITRSGAGYLRRLGLGARAGRIRAKLRSFRRRRRSVARQPAGE